MIASDDVEHGEDEEPHAAGDENGIEHGILLRGCGVDESRNRKPTIDADQCCTAEELTLCAYKFEIDLRGRLYKRHI
jgi:hypothetical protein